MYNLRKGSKTSCLRGIDEFLSIENQSAGQEEEQTAEPAPGEEQRVVDPPVIRAAGKRKLSADEAGQYDKQIRQKLLVDSPPKGQQKSKLMAEAIKAAIDEEQQESSVAGLPHRAGLRSHGPALSSEASSYHPPEGEEDELMAADAESAPMMDLPKSPALEPGGSPSPGTTATTTSEPEPAQMLAPLVEQHLPGSPTTTVSPAALPETTAATPPPEQQLVQVSALMQEQALPASSTVAASSTALMKISLAPTEAGPSASPARAMMALTSSPSQLNVSVASATSTPKSLANPYFGASTSGVVESSSIAFSSPADAPDFLHISLSYLNSLVRKVIEVVTAGRGRFDSLKYLLEAGLNGVKSVGNAHCFERCSEAISHLEAQLKHLEALSHEDIQTQIVSTFADFQVEEVTRRESDLRQKELELSTASLDLIRTKLVEAEAEVLRLKAQLSREEAVVNILGAKNTNTLLNYHTEAQALERAKKEAVAEVAPTEDDMRKKAEAVVRASHEEKLADAKAQLASFDLTLYKSQEMPEMYS
ncbi:uncharacterized protein LOC109841511 [Asparagus officinalis]|uniref:uncharacterized protein LOC109841511 n=1 Tax=Asparagus officinalis TaxID=4686 RepID=UPI00098DE335|nr:uncharacterized protein LOC109841511 [Asparagus officinalis]